MANVKKEKGDKSKRVTCATVGIDVSDEYLESTLVSRETNDSRRIAELERELQSVRFELQEALQEINRRTKADKALRDSEAKLRAAMKIAPVTVYTCDRNLRYTWVTNPHISVTDESNIIGKRDDEISVLDKRSADLLMKLKKSVLRTRKGVRRQMELLVCNQTYHYDITMEPLVDAKGYVEGLVVAGIDITAQKNVEKKLSDSWERFQQMSDAIPEILMTFMPDGRCEYANARFYSLTGIEAGRARGYGWLDVLHPEDRNTCFEHWRTSVRNGGFFELRYRIRMRNRSYRCFLARACPMKGEGGDTGQWFGSATDIEDLVRAEQALQDARQAADNANRAKTEFLANMSHEIRTPMTAILGYADILSTRIETPENQEYLDTIKQNGDYLIRILNDILDLSRIEVGELEVCHASFSPEDLISDIYSLMKIRMEEKYLKWTVEFDGPVHKTIITDRTRLRQILVNLVSNSIKFTNKGEIKLTSRIVKDLFPAIQFKVIDTGIGMSAKTLKRIFDPFVRGDNALSPGAGLGLAITRRLIDLLKGDIEVKSEEGRGTTFKVTIPIGLSSEASTMSSAYPASKRKHTYNHLRCASDGHACRILVVDDHDDIRKMIQYLLQGAGAMTDSVESGERALELIRQAEEKHNSYDAIILDIHLSGISGYVVAKKLREMNYQGTIIAVTAAAMKYEEEKCLTAGCDYYITKPIDEENLIDLIGRTCFIKAGADEIEPFMPVSSSRVLIVEDHQDSAESIARLLKIKGYEVSTAYDGKSAIEKCRALRPAIIVMDLTLPDMDGLEMLSRVKQTLPDIFAVVLSGRSRAELDNKIGETGFDAYFEKPPNLALLNETLRKFMQSREDG